LNRLRVITEAVIGRVLLCPTCIPDSGSHYPVDAPELGVRPPESAKGDSRRLTPGRSRPIHGRDQSVSFYLRCDHSHFLLYRWGRACLTRACQKATDTDQRPKHRFPMSCHFVKARAPYSPIQIITRLAWFLFLPQTSGLQSSCSTAAS